MLLYSSQELHLVSVLQGLELLLSALQGPEGFPAPEINAANTITFQIYVALNTEKYDVFVLIIQTTVFFSQQMNLSDLCCIGH